MLILIQMSLHVGMAYVRLLPPNKTPSTNPRLDLLLPQHRLHARLQPRHHPPPNRTPLRSRLFRLPGQLYPRRPLRRPRLPRHLPSRHLLSGQHSLRNTHLHRRPLRLHVPHDLWRLLRLQCHPLLGLEHHAPTQK